MTSTISPNPYAALFPGQGPHAPTMLAGVRHATAYAERYALVCQALGVEVEQTLATEGEAWLNRNEVSSLLTVLVSSLSYDYWLAQHPPPTWLAGYSVGQWTALYAAGVVDFATLVTLVKRRADLMNAGTLHSPGSMVGVIGLAETVLTVTVEQLQAEGYQVFLSTDNGLGHYSLAVATAALSPTLAALQAHAPRTLRLLPVAGPWHSPLLADAEAPLAACVEELVTTLPHTPVIDNVTGALLPADLPALRRQLVRQLTAPVRWRQGVQHLIRLGCSQFVELGYGTLLTKFGFFIDRRRHHVAFYTER